jgi:hypothetical protein
MKTLTAIVFSSIILIVAGTARADTYDALKNYSCDQGSAGVWYYEAFSAADGVYKEMEFGHALIMEVSRYGVDGHYLPDGDQPLYPFITSAPEYLFGSPATEGKRTDMSLAWTAQEGCGVSATGFVRLMGNLKGDALGKTVKAEVLLNNKVLWDAELGSGETKQFEVKANVAAGDRLRLRVQNVGDKSDNITAFNMRVETKKK